MKYLYFSKWFGLVSPYHGRERLISDLRPTWFAFTIFLARKTTLTKGKPKKYSGAEISNFRNEERPLEGGIPQANFGSLKIYR